MRATLKVFYGLLWLLMLVPTVLIMWFGMAMCDSHCQLSPGASAGEVLSYYSFFLPPLFCVVGAIGVWLPRRFKMLSLVLTTVPLGLVGIVLVLVSGWAILGLIVVPMILLNFYIFDYL